MKSVILVGNIGLDDGLMPYDTNQLPEPILTSYKWGSVALTWKQFHSKYPIYFSV